MNPLLPPTRANRFDWIHETVGELIPFARDHGVGLAIKNVSFAAFPDANALAGFLDDMGRPKELSICYDVANAHFIGESLTHGFDTLAGDITLLDVFRNAVKDCFAVIHIAARPNIWSGDGDDILRINTLGTWNAFRAAQEASIQRVVLCSSDSVLGYTVREGAMIARVRHEPS